MRYWAHSDRNGLGEDDPEARWQLLREHLRGVGASAAALARLARPHDEEFIAAARAAGLLHDFGKYSQEFQGVDSREGETGGALRYGAALAWEAKAWEIGNNIVDNSHLPC